MEDEEGLKLTHLRLPPDLPEKFHLAGAEYLPRLARRSGPTCTILPGHLAVPVPFHPITLVNMHRLLGLNKNLFIHRNHKLNK